jgi:hypothetical protein
MGWDIGFIIPLDSKEERSPGSYLQLEFDGCFVAGFSSF